VALLSQPKRLALACYLAAPPPHGGRCYHRKDTLVGMFWPELDQQHARAALRNTLYFLRQHLGATVIVTEGDMVGVDPNELWCDLDAFDVAVRRRDFAAAYQLYRGGLLEGLFISDAEPFEEWLEAQRQRRSTEAQDAVAQAARRHAVAGRIEEALVWARRAREMAPLNEDAARLLITLRFVTGNRAGALDEYRRLEALLDAEHGVSPSADTQRLVKAIRDPDADVSAVANAIAQLPLPPSIITAHVRDNGSADSTRVHGRDVLDAFVDARVGLARRKGDRVPLVVVTLAEGAGGNGDGSGATGGRRRPLDVAVLGAIRAADVVAAFDSQTLVILPADDGALDVTALVGRVRQCLDELAGGEGESMRSDSSRISALWLDPATGQAARELLADALGPQ
jgi:DNA-binding SARP family transcriptional activator